MRILFVDDERSVLEGIQNRLRKYRKVWHMDFSDGGEAALSKMRKAPFDTIVSDMRMPGMDGAELLTKIREEFSGTLRIVLTGQTAKEQILRSLAVAHRVLNKPCDAVLLEAAITDASEKQALIDNNAVRKLIDNTQELPALPKLHLQLTNLIKTGEYDLQVASKIVEQDPVIAGRVLQLVNSSFYSLAREVTSIKDAVSYLGTDCLRGLILNLELFSALEDANLANSFSLKEMQSHALTTARISAFISNDKEESDLLYTAALLHDIGQLILAYVLPNEYDEIIEQSRGNTLSLVENERQALGFTHADVGAYLLSLWDLPFSLIQAVGNHHKPSKTSEHNLKTSDLVYTASEIAQGINTPDYSPSIDKRYIEDQTLQEKISELSNEIKEGKASA